MAAELGLNVKLAKRAGLLILEKYQMQKATYHTLLGMQWAENMVKRRSM
jgi:hypothetical protein